MNETPAPAAKQESTIEEALAAIRAGRPVIVVDEHDRENEGDFVCAAESVTAATIDFMVRRGRGVLCAPLTDETAARLRLTPMVPEMRNTAPHRTPFLVPVDHREAGTGVSPQSRA
ncbi:MAG: 3,4-dihydroxy-2-butanone-4-phosphate synthase, partial [Planctomycetota bacterium]